MYKMYLVQHEWLRDEEHEGRHEEFHAFPTAKQAWNFALDCLPIHDEPYWPDEDKELPGNWDEIIAFLCTRNVKIFRWEWERRGNYDEVGVLRPGESRFPEQVWDLDELTCHFNNWKKGNEEKENEKEKNDDEKKEKNDDEK